MSNAAFGLLAVALASATTGAAAQGTPSDDVVVMRRLIAPPRVLPPAWHDDPADWAWAPGAPTCGTAVRQVRTVSCQKLGNVVSDEQCTAEQPAQMRLMERTDGCTYAWVAGDYGAPDPVCSAATARTRTVQCRRSDGATAADEALCRGERPQTQMASAFEGCTYAWRTSPTPACSRSSPQNVQCIRSPGGTAVAETFCTSNAGVRPPDLAENSQQCEQVASGTMDSSAGYYGLPGVTFADGVARMTGRVSNPGYFAYDVPVTNGALYRVKLDWKGTSAPSVCSHPSRGSLAVWRFPAGRNGGAQGNFLFDAYRVCGGVSATRSFTFRANYTGPAQIVVWLEGPDSGATVTAEADNLSFMRVPE